MAVPEVGERVLIPPGVVLGGLHGTHARPASPICHRGHARTGDYTAVDEPVSARGRQPLAILLQWSTVRRGPSGLGIAGGSGGHGFAERAT